MTEHQSGSLYLSTLTGLPNTNVLNALYNHFAPKLGKMRYWAGTSRMANKKVSRIFNHFSTTGGTAHDDVSIRQAALKAAREAFVTSSFKIFLTQTFPLCGATCYIIIAFEGDDSAIQWCQFCLSLSGIFPRTRMLLCVQHLDEHADYVKTRTQLYNRRKYIYKWELEWRE